MSEKKAELSIYYTREEYMEFYYLSHSVLSKPSWFIATTLVLTILVLGILFTVLTDLPADLNPMLLYGVGAVLAAAGAYLIFYPRLTRKLSAKVVDGEYQSGEKQDNRKRMAVGDKGVTVESFDHRRFFPWEQVVDLRGDEKFLLLRYENGDGVLLPRLGLSEAALHFVVERVGKKLKLYP